MAENDEFELMQRIGRGDTAAFRTLYERYQGPLTNFLHKMSWDTGLAEELLQEVFLSVWRTAARFESRAKVSTYLYTLARNAFINASRKGAHRRIAEAAVGAEGDRADESGADPDRDPERAKVRAAVDALPPEERETLVLAFYNGVPYPQVAEILGVPVGTVKSRVHRALGRLRERFKA